LQKEEHTTAWQTIQNSAATQGFSGRLQFLLKFRPEAALEVERLHTEVKKTVQTKISLHCMCKLNISEFDFIGNVFVKFVNSNTFLLHCVTVTNSYAAVVN